MVREADAGGTEVVVVVQPSRWWHMGAHYVAFPWQCHQRLSAIMNVHGTAKGLPWDYHGLLLVAVGLP